jgi:hypothetical protein
MPSKTIVDFANQVKSYALGIKDQQVLGAWNFVENTATTETRNGVTFTVNPVGYPKGTIKINSSGAPTGGIDFVVNTGFKVPANTYYLKQNDFPSTGNNSRISVYKKGVGEIAYDGNFDHEHRKFTLSEDTELIYRIFANKDGSIGALDDVIIYPMISLEDDTPYVPYAMTNRELTEAVTVEVLQCSDFMSGVTTNRNSIRKMGELVILDIDLTIPSASGGDLLCVLPSTCKPWDNLILTGVNRSNNTFACFTVKSNGQILARTAITNSDLAMHAVYTTN